MPGHAEKRAITTHHLDPKASAGSSPHPRPQAEMYLTSRDESFHQVRSLIGSPGSSRSNRCTSQEYKERPALSKSTSLKRRAVLHGSTCIPIHSWLASYSYIPTPTEGVEISTTAPRMGMD